MPTPRLTPELIAAAIAGYEAQRARIDEQIAELRAMLPGRRADAAATPAGVPRNRRQMSAAARARIAAAQKKRWAAVKTSQAPERKPKRRLSAAGRRAIIEATKKRWAAVRAAKAEQAKTTGKKPAGKAE